MIAAFLALAGSTANLSLRVGGGALVGLLFFLCVVVVFPFGVGPNLALLAEVGPGILWVAALLATLLGLDRLFQDDRDDGSLDLLALSPLPLELVFLAKAAGHWLATGLPLVIGAPVFGIFLNVPPEAVAAVTLTLLVGTPALTLIGGVGSALMTVLRRGGMLVAVLILPLAIPVMVFGVSAALAAGGTVPFLPPFLILSAITLAMLVVAPVAGAAALRAALD
jgi:heme exporter protein B